MNLTKIAISEKCSRSNRSQGVDGKEDGKDYELVFMKRTPVSPEQW